MILSFYKTGFVSAHIDGFAAVERMDSPEHWNTFEQARRTHIGGSDCVYVRHSHVPDIYVAMETGGRYRASITDLLSQPPHELSEQEYVRVRTYVDQLATKVEARTEILNGKTVVVIDWRLPRTEWDDVSRVRTVLAPNPDSKGRMMTAISYYAPPEVFEFFLGFFEEMLESVVWKACA